MSRLVSSDRKPLKQVLSTTRPTRISVLSRSERLIAFESVGRRPIIGRSSADNRPTHRPMICGSFKYDIGRVGRSSADCQNLKTVVR